MDVTNEGRIMKTIYNKDNLVAETDGEGVILTLYNTHKIEMTVLELIETTKKVAKQCYGQSYKL